MGAEQAKPEHTPINEKVVNLFSQLFHADFPAKALVRNFTANTHEWTYFLDRLEVFTPPTIVPDDIGTSGKIYIDGDRIIKEIPIVHSYNLRGVFLECWIQTTLHNDALYGSHIPQLFSIKRSKSKEMGNLSIFLTMERITDTFQNVLGTDSITLAKILPYFKQLSQILEHFDTKYAFRHRDLHYRNVLVKGCKLYLIDFGRSSIENKYSQPGEYVLMKKELRFSPYSAAVRWENVFSWSPPLDILTFLTSIREMYYRQMDAECKALINQFVDDTIYSYMEKKRGCGECVYFQTYACKIWQWDETMKASLEKKVSIREFSKEIIYHLEPRKVNLNAPAYADID